MTPSPEATREAYATVGGQTGVIIFDDLVHFARSLADPLVSAGATLAANHFIWQTKGLQRAKAQGPKGVTKRA